MHLYDTSRTDCHKFAIKLYVFVLAKSVPLVTEIPILTLLFLFLLLLLSTENAWQFL